MKTIVSSIKKTLALLSLVFIVFACSTEKTNTESDLLDSTEQRNEKLLVVTKEQFDAAGLELGAIEQKSFKTKVKTNGQIDVPPSNKAQVNTVFPGYVKDVLVLIGQKVKKGEVLYRIENPAFIEKQKKFLEAKSNFEYLKADFERQKRLFNDNSTSEKVYLKAKTEYEIEQANYTSLSKELELMGLNPASLDAAHFSSFLEIKSPIAGVVDDVAIQKGQFVEQNTFAMSVINLEHLHIELKVFEKDLLKVKEGQKIAFSVLDNSGKNYEAEVHLVGKSIDSNTRTATIHGHIISDITDLTLIPGMYVDADIFVEEKNLHALPNTSVIDLDEEKYVLKLIKSEADQFFFERIAVLSDVEYDGYKAVRGDKNLDLNQKYLTKGAFALITD